MKSSAKRIGNRAFTLLEVLVAGVVLTLGVILVLQGITGAMAASGRISRREQAQALAGDLLDRAGVGEIIASEIGVEVRAGVEYSWRMADAALDPPLIRMTCTVRWPKSGKRRSVQLERIVAP